jgi:hypothetical protein
LNVGDLREELSKLEPDCDVYFVVDGLIVPAVGMVSQPGVPFIILQSRTDDRSGVRFTVSEEGVLNRLVLLGKTDAEIGAMLGRSAESIRRRRKAPGRAKRHRCPPGEQEGERGCGLN